MNGLRHASGPVHTTIRLLHVYYYWYCRQFLSYLMLHLQFKFSQKNLPLKYCSSILTPQISPFLCLSRLASFILGRNRHWPVDGHFHVTTSDAVGPLGRRRQERRKNKFSKSRNSRLELDPASNLGKRVSHSTLSRWRTLLFQSHPSGMGLINLN